jgi:hypothetical protein
MSNFEYEDEDDDFTTPVANDSNDLVKQLRKAAKQKDKELQELRSQFENLSKAQRERAIKDTLESRGVNSKIAKFIPSDIDPTEESLSKWLDENGDVFGFQATPTNQTANVDPADIAAYKRMNQTTEQGLTPDSSDDLMRKILSAQTPEELGDILRQSGL